MKWIKKFKKDIIWGVQFFLIGYTMVQGFWWTYILIWFKVGLPIEWYSILVTIVLALFSVFGLFQWIRKTNYGRVEDGK